jgi:hypothetical protein
MPFRQARILWTLLGAILCAGCSTTYHDKKLDAPGAPTAAVLIQKFPIIGDFILYKIDDHNRPVGFKKRFEVVPGPHSVTVGVNEGLLTGNRFRIAFDAKPGETYEINAKVTSEKIFSGTWHTWVTEVSTGKEFEGEVAKR